MSLLPPEPSVTRLAPGVELDGWLLEARLGAGGMGEVFRATQLQTGISAALKVMLEDEPQSGELFRRFRREVQVLARVSHPAVVRVLQEALDHSPPYFCMELLPGGSLADRIAREQEEGRPGLELAAAAQLGLELAEGLAAVHALKVLHRDLKPQNVLFTVDGQAKLADFGIAKPLDRTGLTLANTVMGTLPYLPPEVLQGKPGDERSDLYQFGVLLFQAVAGKFPFQAGSLVAASTGHPLPPAPKLESLGVRPAPELGRFQALLERLLASSREGRPESARETARILRALVAAIEARAAGLAPPPEEPPTERPHTTGTRPKPSRAGAPVPVTKGDGPRPQRRAPRTRHVTMLTAGLTLMFVVAAAGWWHAGTPAASPEEALPRALAPGTPDPGNAASAPRPALLAIGAGTDRAEVWLTREASASLEIEYWPRGKTQRLRRTLPRGASRLTLSGLRTGTAYEGLLDTGSGATRLEFETLSAMKAANGPFLLVTDPSGVYDPALARRGLRVAMVWRQRKTVRGPCFLWLKESFDGGLTWTPREEIPGGGERYGSPEVDLPEDGLAVAWPEPDVGTSPGGIELRFRPGGAVPSGASPEPGPPLATGSEPLGPSWPVALRIPVGPSPLLSLCSDRAGRLDLLCCAGPREQEKRALRIIRVHLPAGPSGAAGPAGPTLNGPRWERAGPPLDLGGRYAINASLRVTGEASVVAVLTEAKKGSDRTLRVSRRPAGTAMAWSPLVTVSEPGFLVHQFELAASGKLVSVAYDGRDEVLTSVSRDGGLTFRRMKSPFAWSGGSLPGKAPAFPPAVAIQGDKLWLVSLTEGVLGASTAVLAESTDGLSWKLVAQFPFRVFQPMETHLLPGPGRWLMAVNEASASVVAECLPPPPDR